MFRFTRPLLAIGLIAAALALPASASAKAKHHVHRVAHRAPVIVDSRPPLEVNRRSWLDPGPVVPQGSLERYVQDNTYLVLTQDQMRTDRFGNSTLPRRFDPPGRPVPLYEFWSPTGE